MPIYQYKCKKCHLLTEKLLKVDERNKDYYCDCGQKLVRETETPAPPQFVGTGWTPKFN